MRLTFAADLHGRVDQLEQLLELAWREKSRLLLLGGDLFPQQPSIRDDPQADLDAQRRFVDEVLRPRLQTFLRLAPAVSIYWIPGNMDWTGALAAARPLEEAGLWRCVDGQRVALPDGWDLLGLSAVPLSPSLLKDHERLDRAGAAEELTQEVLMSDPDGRVRRCSLHEHLMDVPTVEELLAALPPPRDPRKTICLFHGPPAGTHCDVIFDGRHVGSQAARDWIERTQPALVLCGHIHESPYKTGTAYDRIGQTVVCNPGAGELRVHAVTLDLARREEGVSHAIFGVEYPLLSGPTTKGPDFTL